MNRFHNLSTEQLADQIGHADQDAKAAADFLTALKDEFKRRGAEMACGAEFEVKVSDTEATRIDTTKLKADLGDALEPYMVTAPVRTLRVKPVNPMRRAA